MKKLVETCDRCAREVKGGLYEFSCSSGRTESFELCAACASALRNWLKDQDSKTLPA
jgi:hypothetical protein